MTRLRRLGRTGIEVSECTLGTARLTAAHVDRAEAAVMLAHALDQGINAIEIAADDIDAASLLGEILCRENAAQRVHVFARIPSPVPFDLPSPHVPAGNAYPGRHIRAGTEALLARLGVERLALVQLHAWCPEWLDEGDWRETMECLRGEGKIVGFGVSLFDHDVDAAHEAVAGGAIDSVQVMYNIFDPGAANALLPLCARHDVAVIARSPLYFGALAGLPQRFAQDDWRADYFYEAHRQETEQRGRSLAEHGPVAELALRFSLSHPAVSTIAVGMETRAQLEANLRALDRGELAADVRASLARHRWLC